jgi:hypothetical protein
MRSIRSGLWAGGIVVAIFGACAYGGDGPTPFPRGTRDVAVYGSYGNPTFGDDERYYSVGGSAGYYFADNWSVNLTLVGHQINSSSGATGVAGETNLQARWHFLRFDRWTVFVDGGCGFIYSDHELPADGHGTHWNFTPQVGLGATYQLQPDLFLLGGVREFHASNGGLQGSDRHPGSNAVMGYLGVMWTF